MRKLSWVLVFGILSVFTLFTVGNATGWAQNKAYAETIHNNHMESRGGHKLVVVDVDNEDKGVTERLSHFSSNEQAICQLSATQAAELDAFFEVNQSEVNINGEDVTIATVSGRHLTSHQLKEFLRASDASLECHLVGQAHVFFLPVIPQVS